MLIILLVFLTAVCAGLGFWFYNRRQINSLTETLEDKNAIISSFREHLSTPIEEVEVSSIPIPTVSFSSDEIVVDMRSEKKKQEGSNKPKKNSSEKNVSQTKQQQKQNSEKKNRPNKQRKPKTKQ